MQARPLKKAVIREELVALTGDHISALILGQLLYWTERMGDVDAYLEEEQRRAHEDGVQVKLDEFKTHGWIYKTAEQLGEELMLSVSPRTIRRHLDYLVRKGWLFRRSNPRYRWDKTYQYRVNLKKVKEDLQALGYPFDWLVPEEGDVQSGGQNVQSDGHHVQSSGHSVRAIPEITNGDYNQKLHTEITPGIRGVPAADAADTPSPSNRERSPGGTAPSIEAFFERLQAKSPPVDLSWVPEPLKPWAIAFIGATGITPLRAERKRWLKDLRAFREAGIDPGLIPKAVQAMRRDGLTIKAPGSVLAVARDMAASKTQDVPKSWHAIAEVLERRRGNGEL